MHKKLLIALIAMVGLGALLTIVQMWVPILDWDVFIKVLITLGIFVLLIGFVIVIKADLGEHKKLKDENYLD